MDASSVDSPSKHLVGNETDKTLILSCETQMENNVSSKMDKRILALETTLQELGGHFIKYQEDVMGILVQECSRLTQQMYEQKEKIQKMTHDQVQNALSRTHDDIFHELRTEMKRLLESNITSMNESRDTMSQKETASTAASEDPDASVELRKLRDEMRKEIHEVHSVLNVRASATEKRLEELESGISFQGNEVGPLTKKTHAGVSLSQQRRALSRDASIRLSTTREASPMPVISMGDHINELIREQSAQPAPPPRLAWKQTLEEWRRSTLLLTTQPSPAIRSSDIMSAAENLSKAPAPNESVYQGMGSCQIPVPVLEGNKRAGSIQLRVQDGTMSLNVPRHDALSRSMPRMAASPFAPRSRMSMTVRDAASPPPGVRSNDRTDSAFQTSWSKPASSPFVRGTPKISPSQYQKGFPTLGVAGQ